MPQRTALILGIVLSTICVVPEAKLWADTTISSRSRTGLSSSQMRLLDGRLSDQYQHSARLRPEPDVEIIPSFRGSYTGPHLLTARAAAERNGIPPDLFLRLVQKESGWREDAVSDKGAIGLGQLMPDTAQDLRVDPLVPSENLDGAARYLAQQFRRFGSWRLALAAYNAGPEAVASRNAVPPFAETQDYVRQILGR
jgi:soluble lytic murein transglycosylase-like protein